MNKLLLISIMLHIIGDYYMQSSSLADKKGGSFAHLLLHCAIYTLPFAAVFAFINPSVMLALTFSAICIGHFVIDTAKFLLLKKITRLKACRSAVYVTDQLLHFAVMIAAAYIFKAETAPYGYLDTFLSDMSLSFDGLIKWIVLLLIIYKPSNITFSVLLSRLKPPKTPPTKQALPGNIGGSQGLVIEPDSEQNGFKNAGGIIGFLERLMVVVLLSLSQYAAIGLVLTAKSIARYERITKEPKFAEYYLIGTLTSMLGAFISYYMIFGRL